MSYSKFISIECSISM